MTKDSSTISGSQATRPRSFQVQRLNSRRKPDHDNPFISPILITSWSAEKLTLQDFGSIGELFAAFRVAWANSMKLPGFRSSWAKFRGEFPEDFCQYIDGISTAEKSAPQIAD
jgi:hypothetical protein